MGSVDKELEKPVEDGINNADTDSILQEENDDVIDDGETEETEECGEASSEVSTVGLRPKRPVTCDHR